MKKEGKNALRFSEAFTHSTAIMESKAKQLYAAALRCAEQGDIAGYVRNIKELNGIERRLDARKNVGNCHYSAVDFASVAPLRNSRGLSK